MTEHPPPTAILETALYAPDLDAAEAFYGTLLGLPKVTRAGNRHVFFRLPAAMLLIFNPAETAKPPTDPALPVPPHGARGPGHIAFAATADEIDQWRQRLAPPACASRPTSAGPAPTPARSTSATPPATPSSSPSPASGASDAPMTDNANEMNQAIPMC